MLLTLFAISLIGGFLSGLLGIGGAVILIPMMLSIPVLAGVGSIPMKMAAGLSMIQVLLASLTGVIVHTKNKNIDFRIMRNTGIPMGLSALAGSYVSKYMSDAAVAFVFLILVVFSFFIMIRDGMIKKTRLDFQAEIAGLSGSVVVGIIAGILSGIAGVGGGFILIPLMTVFMHLPVKKAVGTSLGIVLIGALFGSAGKMITFQVEYVYIFPIAAGSILASQAGARLSCRLSPQKLRNLLLTVIFLSIVQSVLKILKIY